MISDAKINIFDIYGILNYVTYNGVFFTLGKLRRITSAHSCREIFGWNWTDKKSLVGFYGNTVNIKTLDRFFDYFESKINLKERTIFYPCVINKNWTKQYNKNVVVMKLSPFWLENSTNKSMFTLLLRCGGVYYQNDINKALNKYGLSRVIASVIKWFFKGNTKPTYIRLNHWGIVDKFTSNTDIIEKEKYKTMLVKP